MQEVKDALYTTIYIVGKETHSTLNSELLSPVDVNC